MGKGILKFINYTKEAFFWPFHLVSLGILAVGTTAAAITGNYFFDLDPTGLIFAFGGAEMLLLSTIARSRRFRRAINGKHGKDLQTFAYLKEMTEVYNALTPGSQRRFEELRKQVLEAKQNYSKLNNNFPDLVKDYITKMDSLQINFVRLLAKKESFPKMLQENHPDKLNRQIQDIRSTMVNDSPTLRDIKEKRIKLVEQRIAKFYQSNEKYHSLDQQLRTIEEMVKFFAEQPMASSGDDDIAAIDSLIDETNILHTTLGEVDEIMRSDLQTVTSLESNYSGSGQQGGLYTE